MKKCGDSLLVERSAPQSTGGSAILTSPLHFSRCKLKDVVAFVVEHHYAHSVPGGIDYSFRLDWNGKLAGVCLIGMKTGNVNSVLIKGEGYKPTDFRELVRLVLLTEVPKNSESQFIGWCVRYMKKNSTVKAIVSFADPEHGHSGIVYKASNWRYDGLQQGRTTNKIIIDGVDVHPRSAASRFGTASKPALMRMAARDAFKIEFLPRVPKHRYIYGLR